MQQQTRESTPRSGTRSYNKWCVASEQTLINFFAGVNNDGKPYLKYHGKSEDNQGKKRGKNGGTKMSIAGECVKYLQEHGLDTILMMPGVLSTSLISSKDHTVTLVMS